MGEMKRAATCEMQNIKINKDIDNDLWIALRDNFIKEAINMITRDGQQNSLL